MPKKRDLFKEFQDGIHQTGKKTARIANRIRSDIASSKAMANVATQMIGLAVIDPIEKAIEKQMKLLTLTELSKSVIRKGYFLYGKHSLFVGRKKAIEGPGIIVFKELSTGKMSVSTTVDLALFLKNISTENAAKGKYGKGPKAMGEFEIYFETHIVPWTVTTESRKLRAKIRQAGLNKV